MDVSPTVLSLLVQHAMNCLPEPEDDEAPCCSNCCGPCAALDMLRITGELDAAVLEGGFQIEGYYWWDGTGVDRKWLAARTAPDCEMCRGT
jgi:hypothetical protein